MWVITEDTHSSNQ